ncbi:MAG: hypothetical protein K2V38_03665 [Gemmataceae bacterium]|nr:hypothetical protein [Gemmataceae bacterium]
MLALLLSGAAFLAQADAPQRPGAADDNKNKPAIPLDGTWTVLCAEKDGQPMPDAKNMTVTARGDTITCAGKDGKPAMTLKVEFGPNATIKVKETTGAAGSEKTADKVGVYVLTQDFLSLCVHDAPAAGTGAAGNASGKEANKCTFVLKRAGNAGTKPNDC